MLGGHILMKTFFRISVLGLVLTAFSAVSAVAQSPCDDAYEVKDAIYQSFKKNRLDTKENPRTLDKAKASIKSGEDFVAKYSACEADKPVVDFINKNLPDLKDYVKKQELYARFNSSIADIKTVNADEAFSSGKEIINLNPDLALDVAIVLASVGFDNSLKTPPVDKYNGEAINFAKKAISDIETGKTSKTYGAKVYSLAVLDAQKKPDAAKSKQNVLGWLNYMIGSIMFYNQQNKKDAVPYFYKATKYDSPTKNKADLYQAIGAWYLDEILKIDKDRLAKIEANTGKDNDETLALYALEKGYADRAIDAYARAYKIAPTTNPTYRTGLFEKLQALYKIRFDKTDGINDYVSTVMSKPMPDPATAVTPVVEETKPATTTTGTTSTTTPSTTKPTTDATTKPTSTPTTKPATDTTTKPATTTPTKPTSTTTTKPSTSSKSKTATKKKGTR